MNSNNQFWLVNLPHAGGSSTVFRGWNKKIECNVLNVEYPGHWTRMKEPLINSFKELALEVIRVIRTSIPRETVIFLFGHSIGAILAWYISPALIKDGYLIKRIFLSGSQNPGSFPEKSILQSSSDDEMLKLIGYKVREHDESINRQFMKTFFPILKNDLEVCKSFVNDGHFVDVESVVIYGKEDTFTHIDEMRGWANYVRLISVYGFHGEHLFIENRENVESISKIVNKMIHDLDSRNM